MRWAVYLKINKKKSHTRALASSIWRWKMNLGHCQESWHKTQTKILMGTKIRGKDNVFKTRPVIELEKFQFLN